MKMMRIISKEEGLLSMLSRSVVTDDVLFTNKVEVKWQLELGGT